MACMAGSCSASSSSGVVFRGREVGGNGALLAHYNGLRPMENMHVASSGTKSSGFVSSSGNAKTEPCWDFRFKLAV